MPNALDPKYEYEVAAAIYPDPLALHEKDPDWKEPFYYKHRIAYSSALASAFCRMVGMYYLKRPVFSGIQKTASWFVLGGVLGEIGQIYMEKFVDFRSQVHRHYIQLHPERFPPPKKEKIGDRFDPWVPVRA